MNALQALFLSSSFIPHGHCYLWQRNLVGLHVVSDGVIAIAYFSIPLMLIYFVRKREDVPFRSIFVLFGLFIISCGTSHLVSIWTLWHPTYWVEGVIKAVTALVSLYTALSLFPILPKALALPSPEKLQRLNQELASQVEERKQAEAALRELNQALEDRVAERTAELQKSEQRFRSLFESAPDFIHVLDTQGVIQQVNPTVVQYSGFSETELSGKPLMSFLSPQTQRTCEYEFKKLLAEGHHRQEMEFVCQDGKVRILDSSCTLVADGDNQDPYVLVLQRDVSERKRAEATLQEAERRWRSLLENVRLLVVGLDQSGQVDYINPYGLELMGYDQAELLGKDWFESCLPHGQAVPTKAAFNALLNDLAEVSPYYTNSVQTYGGNERLIAWNTTRLRGRDGAITGTMSIGEDITERYALQLMKDEFISVVSHELRTPLTSIHGALDLLNTGVIPLTSGRGQHVLNIAADNANRLVRLVNDILELERLESGKIKLEIQNVETTELTSRAEELMQVLAERAQVQLKIADPGLVLQGDGDRLIQVLTNLIDNAIKFSEAESAVSVTVEPLPPEPEPRLLFQVTDQGRGIPKQQLDQIFERFQQVDASDSRSKGGTGLGLAICRSIVLQHGGRIWVESEEGQGSCFQFTIPTGGLV